MTTRAGQHMVCTRHGCLNSPPAGDSVCRYCRASDAAEDEWDRLLSVIRNYGTDEDRFNAIADALELMKAKGL